ncbi:MAG: sensor histidine kinase [Erysipelotrichaceae bacterium]|nr:sensor histidine kinase [Erysipelotrichaceae bacterium]
MKLFWTYIRSIRGTLAIFFGFFAVFLISFALYGLPLEAVIYPILLCIILGLAYLLYRFHVLSEWHREISRLKNMTAELIDFIPRSNTVYDEDYGEIIQELIRQKKTVLDDAREETSRMMDYYTLWVHQIKTPIASMRLRLQGEDSELSRNLLSELGRIERYVEMVLTYLRLEGPGSDYIFREYELDPIIEEAVKKFAGDFIMRKLKLNYEPFNRKVLTDEKWLSFVIEQLLSNALKYTEHGEISIYVEDPLTLCIEDTGIGISPEDLPRIFERNYTGVKGRADKRASGIGLYLCKRICTNLNHEISAESEVGRGTRIMVKFETNSSVIE